MRFIIGLVFLLVPLAALGEQPKPVEVTSNEDGLVAFLYTVVVAGGILILLGIKGMHAGKVFAGSSGWPTTEGEITSSTIGSVPGYRGDVYWVDIVYSYAVHGASYSAERKVNTVWKWRARKFVSAHSPGTPVLVSYDPFYPGKATDRPGLKVGEVVLCVLGVAAAAFGLGGILGFSPVLRLLAAGP